MHILIIGAGALGGAIGARLLAAGQRLSFLVRPARAAALQARGLRLVSVLGDCTIPSVRCVSAEALRREYDLLILACKANDLPGAIASFAPAVGPDTLILPLLNGMAHLQRLIDTFGCQRVLGGLAMLAVSQSAEGRLQHLNDAQVITLGEIDGRLSPRVESLAALFRDAGFLTVASRQIRLEMWEKCAFIAAAMCAALLAAPGRVPLSTLLLEFRAIAQADGLALRTHALARARVLLEAADPALTRLIIGREPCMASSEAACILADLQQRARRFALLVPWLEQAMTRL